MLSDSLEFSTVGDMVKLDHLVDQVLRSAILGLWLGDGGTNTGASTSCVPCPRVQEEQYTKILTNKVAALLPDIVLTSKGASKLARVRACVAGVTVASAARCGSGGDQCCGVGRRRAVQDMLRERANVAVIPNVKAHLLVRIARLTGATILQSVNHLDKVGARGSLFVLPLPRI